MKMINVQYPYDCTGKNSLFDGKVHQVEPYSFQRITIGGRPYFIMHYFDFSANCEATTMLTEINGSLHKVPLDNYDFLYEYLSSNKLPLITPERMNLPQTIALAQTLQASEIFEGPNHDKITEDEIIEITQYVPLNPNGITSVKGGTFSSSSIKINAFSDDERYYFEKAPSFKKKDDAIQEGISSYHIDEEGIKRYEFVIETLEGETGRMLSMDDEENIRHAEVAMIPGKWKYNIVYADFILKEDYIAAKKASKMEIKAMWPEYRDRHATARAFRDGGDKTLDMSFLNYNGKQIPIEPEGPNLR